MAISAEKVILTAKQLKIDELNRLASSTIFVEVISNLIHSLQAERGASSLYLASSGKRFSQNKQEIIAQSQLLETRFLDLLTSQLESSSYKNAKLLSLEAWVLLGLEDLAVLRKSIHGFKLTSTDSIHAYSRLISGLISLIFDLADTVVDPKISNLLVALFNFIQGKELAGQERAAGSMAFASGTIETAFLQRIIHLIESQTRLFSVFCEFAEPSLIEQWHAIESSKANSELTPLREKLTSTTQTHTLDHNLSEMWFQNCSDRLTDMWELECDLIHRIQTNAALLMTEAKADLKNVKGLMSSLRQNPPTNVDLADRFFDPNIPVELAFSFVSSNPKNNHPKSMLDVLQLQSKRLADMEHQLEDARKALTERKTIEKAKGLLMSRFDLSEDDAYKRMRSTAMEQNKKMFDVAQTIISISAVF